MSSVAVSDDLERVADKLVGLTSRRDPGSAPGGAMRWRPPLAEPAVAAWEAEHGVVLPEDYRAFITRVAGSGTRPFHGLRELGVPDRDNDATPRTRTPTGTRWSAARPTADGSPCARRAAAWTRSWWSPPPTPR